MVHIVSHYCTAGLGNARPALSVGKVSQLATTKVNRAIEATFYALLFHAPVAFHWRTNIQNW